MHSSTQALRAFGYLGNSGNRALKALENSGTLALEALYLANSSMNNV